MPYFDFSPDGMRVLGALPARAFEWPTWVQSNEGQRLTTDRSAVAEATAEQLVKLSTAIVRSDRFTEGSVAGAWESGLILAMARRAAQLVSALDI